MPRLLRMTAGLGIGIGMSLLVGCAGSSPTNPPGAPIGSASSNANKGSYNNCPSAMNLLFQSAQNTVQIYDISNPKKAKQCGQIIGNGLGQPAGLDTDTNGNLYVADASDATALEFAPPYTGAPVVTFKSPGNHSIFDVRADCQGNVWTEGVYVDQFDQTTGTHIAAYNDPNAGFPVSLACDANGNVFTTFTFDNGGGGVDELVAPSYSPTELSISVKVPGGLRWVQSGSTGNLIVLDEGKKPRKGGASSTGRIQSCAGGTASCSVLSHRNLKGQNSYHPYGLDVNGKTAFVSSEDGVVNLVDLQNGKFNKKQSIGSYEGLGVTTFPHTTGF